MNEKDNTSHWKKDEEAKNNAPQATRDLRVPFDMKTFWRNINDKFFRQVDASNINIVIDSSSDHLFTKIGFPRTVNSLTGKFPETPGKVNPHLVSKVFGMYVYIDKFDYNLNNLNNDEIEEEVLAIEDKLSEIEESNFFYFKNLKGKLGKSGKLPSKIDLNDRKITEKRLENLTDQIFCLQMRQFSESISCIKKDLKRDEYILMFDPSEGIDPLALEEYDYKALFKYRDAMSSISVYDLFQEKIHSYYNVTSTDKKSTKKTVEKKNQKNVKDTKENVQIAKVISINYDFCHHCKQRKPGEVMVRCGSNKCTKYSEKPMKFFYVNNTTVVRKIKNFVITNYSGDPKDILDGYLSKKFQSCCKRTYCHFCLKGSYDQVIDQIKDKKDWICPWCTGTCFCSRCIRNDQILKLISLYISMEGDINNLYDDLIERSVVLDKLSANLMLSNIIIIKNDPINKTNNKIIKDYTGKKDYESIEQIITQAHKYREHFLKLKDHFDMMFSKAKHEKILHGIDRKLVNLWKGNKDQLPMNNVNLLGKKKKKGINDEEEDMCNMIKDILNGKDAIKGTSIRGDQSKVIKELGKPKLKKTKRHRGRKSQ